MQKKKTPTYTGCSMRIEKLIHHWSSLGTTVRYHSANLVMPNSYPRDGTFSPHLTTIKDSYTHACTSAVLANIWHSVMKHSRHLIQLH